MPVKSLRIEWPFSILDVQLARHPQMHQQVGTVV